MKKPDYLPYKGRLLPNGNRPTGNGLEDVAVMASPPEEHMREIAIMYKSAYGSALVDLHQMREENMALAKALKEALKIQEPSK